MSYVIDQDVLYPRDAEHRYRLYARRGGELEVLATAAEAGGVGEAIIQLHDDEKKNGGRLSDRGAFGILDVVAGEWLVLPWQRRFPKEER